MLVDVAKVRRVLPDTNKMKMFAASKYNQYSKI